MRYAGFVGPSARARSKIACDDRTVNLYVEKNESGTGKAPYTLYRVPGYRVWCDLGTDLPVRGLYTLNGAAFAISGDTLFQLPSTLGGSATERADGITNPDDGNVSIIGSGDISRQLAFAGSGSLYSFDLETDTLALIPDIEATQLVFMSASGIALDPNTSTLYQSAVSDFSSWDPLDLSQRSSAADKMLAITRVATELWQMGSQTTTILYDAGSAGFSMSPNPNIYTQRGIVAPWSIATADGKPIWLGTGLDGAGTVYMASGYVPQPISTSAVEYQFSTYSTLLDAEAVVYQMEGHLFYRLNFPTAGHTWQYDVSEGMWTEVGNWNGLEYGQLPVRGHIYCFDTHLVGSNEDGKIYEMTQDVATETDATTAIRWLRRAPHLCEELRRVTYSHFRLDAEVGVGLASAVEASADPHVYLRWSDDGGQSFSNVFSASLGAIGQYGTLVDWRMLGQGRDRVFEVFGAAPVVTALIDAYLTVRPGTS